jgi:hypothetical protein
MKTLSQSFDIFWRYEDPGLMIMIISGKTAAVGDTEGIPCRGFKQHIAKRFFVRRKSKISMAAFMEEYQ